MDFATELRGVGVKGEAAYVHGRRFPTPLQNPDPDKVVQKDLLSYVFGVDCFWCGKTYTIPQFVQERLLNGHREIEAKAVRSFITFEVRDRFWRDRLEAALRGIVNLTDRDYYLRFRLRYDF